MDEDNQEIQDTTEVPETPETTEEQGHEKVFVYCENMCLEEGLTKDQINELIDGVDDELQDLDTGEGVE